jgi:nitrogen regulatory protein PII
MKQIEAVINRFKLEEVRCALDEIGIEEFMESDVVSHSHQKERIMTFRGARFVVDLIEKVKLEIIAADESVGKIVEAIGTIARTEHKEDCRIAIRSYLEAV